MPPETVIVSSPSSPTTSNPTVPPAKVERVVAIFAKHPAVDCAAAERNLVVAAAA